MSKFINNSKERQLIKNQIQEYIKFTSSNDFYEIRSHCKNLIKIARFNKHYQTKMSNWLNQQLLELSDRLKHNKQQQIQNQNKQQHKSKWKRQKNRRKMKKQQWKIKQLIQKNKIKNKKNKQRKRYTYVYKQSQSHQVPPVPQLESFMSNTHTPTNQPPPPLNTSNNLNLPLINIDDIDIAIAKADQNNKCQSPNIITTRSNDTTYYSEKLYYLDISELKTFKYDLYIHWIDLIIEFQVTKLSHANDTEIVQLYTKNRYGIISNVLISESVQQYVALDIDVIKSATLADGSNNINARRYLRVLDKQWTFCQNVEKLSWIQQIELHNLTSIAMQILLMDNLIQIHPLNILFAIRALNLPFKMHKKDKIFIESENKINMDTHNWQCTFINELKNACNDIIDGNHWLCIIINKYSFQDINSMSKYDSIILINQCNLNLTTYQNTAKYRIAILNFIKLYLSIKKITPTTTLDEIYTAQQSVNANKIKQNKNQFNQAFQMIRNHIGYDQPNQNNPNICKKLGFNVFNLPKRQPLNIDDVKLIDDLQPILPPLHPTNLALGYKPSQIEMQICKLGPKFIPTPTKTDIDFFEIHNGFTKLFNQIKYKINLSIEYINALNAIPSSIFKDRMPWVQQKHKKHNQIYRSTKPLNETTLQAKLDELKHCVFITKTFLNLVDDNNNLTKAQREMLTILENQIIIAIVKQDKGSEFVLEWMLFIIPKIKQIIKKCNLIELTEENVDWLIPNNTTVHLSYKL